MGRRRGRYSGHDDDFWDEKGYDDGKPKQVDFFDALWGIAKEYFWDRPKRRRAADDAADKRDAVKRTRMRVVGFTGEDEDFQPTNRRTMRREARREGDEYFEEWDGD